MTELTEVNIFQKILELQEIIDRDDKHLDCIIANYGGNCINEKDSWFNNKLRNIEKIQNMAEYYTDYTKQLKDTIAKITKYYEEQKKSGLNLSGLEKILNGNSEDEK